MRKLTHNVFIVRELRCNNKHWAIKQKTMDFKLHFNANLVVLYQSFVSVFIIQIQDT